MHHCNFVILSVDLLKIYMNVLSFKDFSIVCKSFSRVYFNVRCQLFLQINNQDIQP